MLPNSGADWVNTTETSSCPAQRTSTGRRLSPISWMKWFGPSPNFKAPDSASHHHAPSELCPAPKTSWPGAVKERRRQFADLLLAGRMKVVSAWFNSAAICRIVEHLGMGHHGERVSGQRPFSENIDKIKRDVHSSSLFPNTC